VRRVIKRIWNRLSRKMDVVAPVMGYGVSFTGVMPTWQQSELQVVSISPFPRVEIQEVDEGTWERLEHNPGGVGFPEVTARFRFPDVQSNDLLVYSESSRSYALIKRNETPQETADLVDKMRAGWTYDEVTKGH
jgi:hypothetical protein